MISEAAPSAPIPVISNAPDVPNIMSRPTKCYPQTTVTNYMQQKGFRIMFNWASPKGELLKLVAVNPKADVMLIHIRGRDIACVIDEIGPKVSASKLFWDFYHMIPNTLNRKRTKKMSFDGFMFERMTF